MKDVFKKIKNVFSLLLGVVFFAFALAMSLLLLNYNKYGLTQFGDTTLIIINGNLTSEKFSRGDLVLVEERNLERLKVGDDAFAYRVDGQGRVSIELGRVGKIYEEENAVAFENGSTFDAEFLAGVPYKTYVNVGRFLSVVESKWGFLFIVLVPCFLIFIYEVYALIIEIKYGAEEE